MAEARNSDLAESITPKAISPSTESLDKDPSAGKRNFQNRAGEGGKKRKDNDSQDSRSQKRHKNSGFGSKRGGGRDKGRDMGRGEYFRNRLDKRERNAQENVKQKERELGGDQAKSSILPKPFTEEEIAQDERKPKRKVAVLIGYSGSGYKGMQISTTEKTIEGDLFTAFVKAGAISKANASDPKKSSLVRCARTDKGVHAAGNIISLKLIVEDADIVQKINEHLSPQIRVWGIERTIGSFSCYQQCDSRWYEYLLPTHALIPPHPSTALGRKLLELAEQAGDVHGYLERQSDIAQFWDEIDGHDIKTQLEKYDDRLQQILRKALYEVDAVSSKEGKSENPEFSIDQDKPSTFEFDGSNGDLGVDRKSLDEAIKRLRAIFLSSKKTYRVQEYRLGRLREILGAYVGTHRFHNYTIKMSYRDSSAKRHIKSFSVSEPFQRDGTEWVSLKVHGQSFMMHQIRKMVGMAANMVRCGTPTQRINESFQEVTIAIPKAPGLGLLLERPVFSSYNQKVDEKFPDKEKLDFGKWEKEINEFKQREIYDRIFREEDSTNQFHGYFTNIDTTKENTFLYLSSMGMEASKRVKGQIKDASLIDGSEDEEAEGGEG